MIADHTTTIVVDFDDTLAITHNRNWEHATPNQLLIDRLNLLYDQGWTIHIVTARGQLSCNGDSTAADKKYRTQIESWCNNHGVKYNTLSFQKKLAAYYIDDKAILPADFVSQFQRTPLVGGLSNAIIYYDKATDSVYKTAKNSLNAAAWYDKANEHGFDVPTIHSVIGQTLRMEYLPSYEGNITSILNLCNAYSIYKPIYDYVSPESYVQRCISRLSSDEFTADERDYVYTTLSNAMLYTPQTFSHGDVTTQNIMGCANDRSKPCMIDPICEEGLYSSYVIDIAKLYMNYGLSYKDEERHEIVKYGPVNVEILNAHELGHLCRLYPYTSDRKSIKNLIRKKCNVN